MPYKQAETYTPERERHNELITETERDNTTDVPAHIGGGREEERVKDGQK